MKIQIPRRLDLLSSLSFCNIIDTVTEDNKYVYDYKDMSTVEPFGMLLLGSKIRNFVKLKENCEHGDCNFEDSEYAAHMGYFKSVYQNFGKEPGEAKRSSSYIPITNKKLKAIKGDPYEYIENISKNLAKILSRNNKELINFLSFGILELLRNVYEHSCSEELWYAAQYWPTKDLVEVAILDEGIGIKNSLGKNKKIDVADDEEAIRLAIIPGISRCGIGNNNKEIYDNAGFGLYMISHICNNIGDFVICSGSKCLVINEKGMYIHETSFNGTAIRIRIKPSKLDTVPELKRMLSLIGSKEAQKYRELSRNKAISIRDIGKLKNN